MIDFIIKTFKRYPWFKRLNAKVTYEILAKKIPTKEWQFMNYGYVPNADEFVAELTQDTQAQKHSMQMYHYLALKGGITGKDVLEVGSGRGGGAIHLAGALQPASYIGLDLAQSAVDLANEMNPHSNLKFIQGSAESIPLDDDSKDVVLNVESCHAYGNVDKFLSEVKRVLKKDGYLLLVDFRSVENMELLKKQLERSGLKVLLEENISKNVINAMEEEDETKKERIKRLIPTKWQKLFAEFAGVVGSRLHTNLLSGERLYYRFVLQKVA